MKHFLFLLSVLFSTTSVYASDIPFGPSESARISDLENVRTLKVTWKASSHGSSTGSAVALGATLPAKAVIIDSFVYVVTQLTDAGNDAGTARVTFQCEDAANLVAAIDYTGASAGDVYGGNAYGNVAATASAAATGVVKAIAADCNISGLVTNDSVSAGELILYLTYFQGR